MIDRGDTIWDRIWVEASKLGLDEDFKRSGKGRFLQMCYRGLEDTHLHYEWLLRGESSMDIALHAEYGSQVASRSVLRPLEAKVDAIRRDIPYAFEVGDFGEKSAQARFVIPWHRSDESLAAIAASVMKTLVLRTWNDVQPALPLTTSETES